MLKTLAAAITLFGALVGAAVHAAPLLDCSGAPCAVVRYADGHRLKLLIDTGDASPVIDTAAAKAAGLTPIPYLGPDGKPVAGYSVVTLKDASLGDARLGDVR